MLLGFKTELKLNGQQRTQLVKHCGVTPGSTQGFKFDAEKDISIEWEDLKALVKQKGLEAYKIYLDRLHSSIEKDF